MRLPRFRVRTFLVLVAAVAMLIWGSMMGARSYGYYRRAREYGANERGWREDAARPNQPGGREFRLQCVEYHTQLVENIAGPCGVPRHLRPHLTSCGGYSGTHS